MAGAMTRWDPFAELGSRQLRHPLNEVVLRDEAVICKLAPSGTDR
jgi:hypothetical protein